ncbi:hypothetical protein CLV33_103229 [Jejuia pallidilutea]|uniref:Uncharacterized protein n=1 Tax=Jejuia pallidilutea TaxID=504487 RepID=A0A362X424_9FLAO|nr:hypothetical protein [Jejuia pallidilutea]PQV49592.1 hypothetical protein CLV33_103229 [Jejuia pallidilutea]
MFKKVLKFILVAPLLMAFQCEDEFEESTLVFNSFKVNISAQSSFSLNDTIWITGKTSSKVFDLALNDSIFAESPRSDIFSIYKFIEPTEVYNCKDAIDKFDLMFDIGQFSALPSCENAQLQVIPRLETNNISYTYRIGLKPNFTGDYVISWQDGIIRNLDRNEFIINNYPIANYPNQIGFNSCDNVSWRFLNESEREYYFTVE